MATGSAHRTVAIHRVTNGRFAARNQRGGEITFGTGDDADFTPTELLLAAIGGCTAIDVDILTSRRAEPESFEISVGAEKIRDSGGNRLTDIAVSFRLTFPAGEAGDAARAVLPDAVRKSHDRLCTVGRTVELGTPIATSIELWPRSRPPARQALAWSTRTSMSGTWPLMISHGWSCQATSRCGGTSARPSSRRRRRPPG
jgi:putative redox protein